jgi:hypothetical protein
MDKSYGIALGNNFYFNMRNAELSRNIPIKANDKLSLNPYATKEREVEDSDGDTSTETYHEPELLYSVTGFDSPDGTVTITEPSLFGQVSLSINKQGNTITIDPPGRGSNTVITKNGDTITVDPYSGWLDSERYNSYINSKGNGVYEIDPSSGVKTTVTESEDSVTLQQRALLGSASITYSNIPNGMKVTEPHKILGDYSIFVTGEKMTDITDSKSIRYADISNDGEKTRIITPVIGGNYISTITESGDVTMITDPAIGKDITTTIRRTKP